MITSYYVVYEGLNYNTTGTILTNCEYVKSKWPLLFGMAHVNICNNFVIVPNAAAEVIVVVLS